MYFLETINYKIESKIWKRREYKFFILLIREDSFGFYYETFSVKIKGLIA